MTYEYEQQTPTPTEENAAEIYVVRDVGAAAPSRELLAALDRLSPGAQALIRQVLAAALQAVVRK